MSELQLSKSGRLKHFLTIEGLNPAVLHEILNTAQSYAQATNEGVRKLPVLRGKTVVNLFFEPSTRTRTTFELAAKRLSADIVNLNVAASSTSKGESLLDTLRTLEAMHADLFVVRHSSSGAAEFFAKHVGADTAVLNAGDGRHAHPTQAMLDAYTIWKHRQDFANLKIVIVGDILHSRVARSEIIALRMLGAGQIILSGPKTLVPDTLLDLGAVIEHDLDKAIVDADFVIGLRLQKERMNGPFLPSQSEYFARYGITEERLTKAKPDCKVMHPGPMNRNVEIESSLADGTRSLILQQVSNGLAVRMAIMSLIAGSPKEDSR